jgi:hypothetical protein
VECWHEIDRMKLDKIVNAVINEITDRIIRGKSLFFHVHKMYQTIWIEYANEILRWDLH